MFGQIHPCAWMNSTKNLVLISLDTICTCLLRKFESIAIRCAYSWCVGNSKSHCNYFWQIVAKVVSFIKKGVNAIPSSDLIKRITKQNLKSRDKAQILTEKGCFWRQIIKSRENEFRNPLIFPITRVPVLCFTYWKILIKIYPIGFWQKYAANITKWPESIKQI